MRRFIFHPLAPLLLFSLGLGVLWATYPAYGMLPSRAFETSSLFGWSLLCLLWLVADARRREKTPCFDFGFLCGLFLPVAVPWYCFSSRGWRGGFLLATILALWVAPYVIASMVWQSMSMVE